MSLLRSGAAFVMIAALTAGAAEPARFAGRPLADALRELQRRGLTLVYSSTLVPHDAVVLQEPRSESPRAILDEILAPHGLAAREAAGGVLVVTRAPSRVTSEQNDGGGSPSPPIFLEEIIVTPSHLRLLRDSPEPRQFLSREDVERMPHLADDVYRAVKQLPGTAGMDISAEFNLRGGATDEMLVILDGLELLAPFHLKDFSNAFSSLDSQAIGGVDLLTGAFPAEFGDRMSGVMDIAVRSPEGPGAASIDIGTINSRMLTSGSRGDGAGHWLVSARAWYPDDTLGLTGAFTEDIRTDYYDFLAKYQQRAGSRSHLALNVFAARDDVSFYAADEAETERVDARYHTENIWLNVFTQWSETLSSAVLLGAGAGAQERTGGVVDRIEGTLSVDDDRKFGFVQFKQDWRWALSERQGLKLGLDIRRMEADYDYSRFSTLGGEPEELELRVSPEGESYGVYLADRIRFGERVIAELGLRWDKQFWTDDHQVSPRLNIMVLAGPRTTARAAWGHYDQSQRLTELPVEDGVTTFDHPQRSEHWLLSVEQQLPRGKGLRVEAYAKEFHELRPRYENLFNPIELFPEALPDRVRIAPDGGSARGIEVIFKKEGGARLTWWLGYALSKAVDEIDGEDVPRSWDQRHAASFGLNLQFPGRWNANLGGTWHTGWPTTAVSAKVDPDDPENVEVVPGPRNGARLPAYLRFDVRISKAIDTRFGSMSVIAEIINLANRENICCIGDVTAEVGGDGSIQVDVEEQSWGPIIPSLSVRWQF